MTTPIDALRELVKHFPTDNELYQIGWSGNAVGAACDAYENSIAAIAAAEKSEPVAPDDGLQLTDEQAAHVGRELARHIRNGATVRKGQELCLVAMPDGSVLGNLVIAYGGDDLFTVSAEKAGS